MWPGLQRVLVSQEIVVFFFAPLLLHGPKDVSLCVWGFFFFWKGVVLPSKVRQSDDSKPCLTTASMHGPSCF